MLKRFLALLFTVFVVTSASAQPTQVVDEIRRAYINLNYDDAERRARTALQNFGEFTVEQLTDIHSILGLIAYNRNEFEEARRQFISALQLTPAHELDPLLVPPKILTYFEDVRSELQSGGIDMGATRYVLVRDIRPEAALRSMIVPGWGQLYKGHRAKAVVLSTAFGAAVGGAVLSHVKRADAKSQYESAAPDSDFDLLFGRYNRWHLRRSALVQGAIVVWLAGYIDALLTDPSGSRPPESLSLRVPVRRDDRLTLLLAPTKVSLHVAL